VKLAATFSNRARPESRRLVSRLGHGALAFLASDPPTLGRLGELRDKFPEHYDAVFRAAFCRIFALALFRILSTVSSPTACVSCHSSVLVIRGVFASARVLTCRMMRETLLLLTIWLDAAEILWSAPLTLGHPLRKSSPRFGTHSGLASRFSRIPRCWFNSPTATTASPRMWPYGCLVLSRHPRLKTALDAVVSHLFGVSSPPSPEVALRRAEETKFETNSEGVRSQSPRHPLHSICSNGNWYSRRPRHGFLHGVGQAGSRLFRDACGQFVGPMAWKCLSRRSCRSRGQRLSAATDGVEAASSSAAMPSPITALFTPAMGRKPPRASSSGA
jgi:hypothetical protein